MSKPKKRKRQLLRKEGSLSSAEAAEILRKRIRCADKQRRKWSKEAAQATRKKRLYQALGVDPDLVNYCE